MKRLIVAVSGASGMVYSQRLICWLVKKGYHVDFLISAPGKKVFEMELGKAANDQAGWRKFFKDQKGLLVYHQNDDFNSPLASGSGARDGMIIIPCSMGMIGRIANGISSSLIERAADVMLKEGKPLALVFRETPLSLIHLENLTRLKKAGAIIIPASPGFYHKPETIEELVDSLVGRVLKQMGIENELEKEWQAGVPAHLKKE